MAKFEPGSAREWALTNLRGVSGCVMPSFSRDQSQLNEEAIRHDIRRERELGFTGFLIVSECGTTAEEFERFVEIAVDEADDLVTIVQAAAGTLEDNVAIAKMAGEKGVDLVMPSYPIGFYPQEPDEVIAYTRAIADATHMGLIIFAMNLWNFGRLHPSGFAPDWMDELVDTVPNIVAIKNEIGDPGVAGLSEVFRRFSGRVLVSDPLEMNAPAWITTYTMPWMGTSNYEYFGDVVPRIHRLAHDPAAIDEAMELYWSVHPARAATGALMREANGGTSFVHRMLWKYQGWLHGFNGGPVRSPHARLHDRQMQQLRAAALASGLPITDEPDTAFFEGRI